MAALVQSVVGGISAGVTLAAAGAAPSRHRRQNSWADAAVEDHAVQGIQSQPVAQTHHVEEAATQAVLPDSTKVDSKVVFFHSSSKGAERVTVPAPMARMASKADAHVGSFSVGSSKHVSGGCKPCAFFHFPEGCADGEQCLFCHRCPPREKQRRKRVRRRLIRDQEARSQQSYGFRTGHSRQGSTGSNLSWESGSTYDGDSTYDSASLGSVDYMSSLGSVTHQSFSSCGSSLGRGPEGVAATQPMMPMQYVPVMVPWSNVPVMVPGVMQGMGGAPSSGAEGSSGYFHAPGFPTPHASSPPMVESVVGECEPTASWPASQQQASFAHGSLGPPAGYTLVPVHPHHMQMPHAPAPTRHMPQHPAPAMPMYSVPMPAQPMVAPPMWRQPMFPVHGGGPAHQAATHSQLPTNRMDGCGNVRRARGGGPAQQAATQPHWQSPQNRSQVLRKTPAVEAVEEEDEEDEEDEEEDEAAEAVEDEEAGVPMPAQPMVAPNGGYIGMPMYPVHGNVRIAPGGGPAHQAATHSHGQSLQNRSQVLRKTPAVEAVEEEDEEDDEDEVSASEDEEDDEEEDEKGRK